jgi:hypothetical protein
MSSLRPKVDGQRQSNGIKPLDHQRDLFSEKRAAAVGLDIATVKRQPTMQAAITLCVAASGLDLKQIYAALDIDAAVFSRIQAGQVAFPPNKLPTLMQLCGNEAPLIWLAEKLGYDFASMRKHRSDLERQLEVRDQEIADLRRLLRLKMEAEG